MLLEPLIFLGGLATASLFTFLLDRWRKNKPEAKLAIASGEPPNKRRCYILISKDRDGEEREFHSLCQKENISQRKEECLECADTRVLKETYHWID